MINQNSIKKIAFIFLVSIGLIKAEAQIGIGINPPNPSAMLHVQDTTRGLLIPRMTTIQKNAISNPAEGLLVYQTDNAKGFWYFTNGQWKNMSATNNGGKYILYLSNNMSNSEAIARIASDAGPNTQVVRIERCSALTTVDLSMITNLTELYISDNPVLQNINLDNLQSVDAGFFVDKCPLLSGMQISHLKKIGLNMNRTYALQITNTAISNLDFTLLNQITGSLNISNNSALTSINCPQLTEQVLIPPTTENLYAFYITGNPSLTNISFPSLAIAGDFQVNSNPNLNSLNLLSLSSARKVDILNTLLTSISLPALTVSSIDMVIGNHSLLNTLSLPVLTTIGAASNSLGLNIYSNPSLSSLSLPAFTSGGVLYVVQNNALATVSLPALSTVATLTFTNSPLLTSLSFPALVSLYGSNGSLISCSNLTSISLHGGGPINIFFNNTFSVNGSLLPSSQVNYLLNKFVSITPPIIPTILDFRQSVAAPPTGQGIIDKATLISRGNTVYTD